MPLTSSINPAGNGTGYRLTDARGNQRTVRIAQVQIDRHPGGGVTFRRVADDGEILDTTMCRNVDEAKQQAAAEFGIEENGWTGKLDVGSVETPLDVSKRHVIGLEQLITHQEATIAKMEEMGDATGAAKGRELLATFRWSLVLASEHSRRITETKAS